MAAAFAALVSLENNLRLIRNHPRHSFSFEAKQIDSLGEVVYFLIKFMKSYDNSYGSRKEAAAALEGRIARAAQAAEDVVEYHVVDQIRGGKTTSVWGQSTLKQSKSTSIRSSRFLLDLQKVIEGMDYMRRKALIITSRSAMEPTYLSATATASTPDLTSNNTIMVGFHDVSLDLLHLLTGFPSSRKVISIVGMGGIGKTTLARNAFEDPLIVERFDVRLWATISQQHSIEKILSQLSSHLGKSASGSVHEMSEALYKSLCGRRYLVILDDMWNVEAWDEVKFLFPDTANGSRIVVTTRDSSVASNLGVSSLAMKFLDEVCSWDLFCQKAFSKSGTCPTELLQIGRKIVEQCKGLPLTIVVVAGHLRKCTLAVDYWENVAHHLSSILNSSKNEHCLNVISLSYSYLPAHLKPCFLLLGAFPEDKLIYAWEVVKLWIAEGFIEHFENSSLEEVAQIYLCDLWRRNLILVVAWNNTNEHIYTFKVHDLVRELCLKLAKKEEFLSALDSSGVINRERRVVISGHAGEVNHERIASDAPIRCLISEGGRLVNDFKLLRTLDRVDASSISECIFQQVNMRYLYVDLDCRTRRTLNYLPSSISLLWNLQILTITAPGQSPVIAPYEIWEMLQLRQLDVNPICLVDPLPVDQETKPLVLRDLQRLVKVENFRLSEEVCKRIPNIKELRLSYCDEASTYYCPHNLGRFHKLQRISLRFSGISKWRDFALSLTFPSSLKSLSLNGCGVVDWEELTEMVGSLPNLVVLHLYPRSVTGSVWSPVEGKFLRLKRLEIRGCDDLVYWNAYKFPVLEYLHLRNLSKLEDFPSVIGETPTLRWIIMEFCNVCATISAMRTLVKQEEEGNESLKLKISLRGDEETLESFNNKVQEEGLTSTNISLHFERFT